MSSIGQVVISPLLFCAVYGHGASFKTLWNNGRERVDDFVQIKKSFVIPTCLPITLMYDISC